MKEKLEPLPCGIGFEDHHLFTDLDFVATDPANSGCARRVAVHTSTKTPYFHED